MPWNDNANPGPWGAPPSGDDGQKSDSGGPRKEEPRRRLPPPPPGVPDLGELLRRATAELDKFFRGPGGRAVRPSAIAAILGAIVLVWALTGVYTVQANQKR